MIRTVILGAIALLALLSGMFVTRSFLERRARSRNRDVALERGGVARDAFSGTFECEGMAQKVLSYMLKLEQRLSHKSTVCLSVRLPFLRGASIAGNVASGAGSRTDAHARDSTSGGASANIKNSASGAHDNANIGASSRQKKLYEQMLHAGLKDKISIRTFCEARLRIGVCVAIVGAIVGACLSNELMAILGIVGFIVGFASPSWALKSEVIARSNRLKVELPELLEVVSLGMSSGLSFDRSFGLYYTYFDTAFSRACENAHRRWTMGFSTRDEALSDLSAQYDSNMLHRVVQNIARSMKFGTSLSDDLKRAAEDSRAEQKAATQEQVAKVPVRMMIPTACLILPAMLLLVLGPVLLELIQGF